MRRIYDDPEVQLISDIDAALPGLSQAARVRVVRWLAARVTNWRDPPALVPAADVTAPCETDEAT
jgi:hypothetical protein